MKFIADNTLASIVWQTVEKITAFYFGFLKRLFKSKTKRTLCFGDDDNIQIEIPYEEIKYFPYIIVDSEELAYRTSKASTEDFFRQLNLPISINDISLPEFCYDRLVVAQSIDLNSFLSASVKQLMRLLALYMGRLQSILFRVLRNTRIHSLSIFFGLCCSSSGYIFEAISGTCAHPIPA